MHTLSQPDQADGTWHSQQPDGVSVHAGFPNPGIDASLQGIDLNRMLIQNSASTFFMTIEGQDWQDLGIFADDIAVIDRALQPQANDLVIWHAGSDFAISYRHRMRPDAAIWGVVTSIIHQYRSRQEVAR